MLESDFLAAGKRIRFSSDRDAIPYRQMLSDLRLAVAETAGAFDAHLRIFPRIPGEKGWNVSLPSDARLIRDGSRKVYQAGDDFYVDFHGTAAFRISACGSLPGGRAEGICWHYDRLDPLFWTELSLNHVLMLLLRRCRIHFVHAGGAVDAEETAFLFVGPNGYGKSTAAMRLASAGWRYLGDDIILIDERLRLHPYPRLAAATEWTVARLGLADRVIEKRSTGKYLIAPWPVAEPASDFILFFPEVARGDRNTIRPLTVDETRLALAGQTEFCHTDLLIGGPPYDLARAARGSFAIAIGSIERLEEDLGAWKREGRLTTGPPADSLSA